jgi:hypothetical protein
MTVICVAVAVEELRPLAKFAMWRLNYCLQEVAFSIICPAMLTVAHRG